MIMRAQLLALALLCGCGAGDARVEPRASPPAQDDVAAPDRIAHTREARIHGIVTDRSGAPIHGARIVLQDAFERDAAHAQEPPLWRETTTDAAGAYAFDHITSWAAEVVASNEGFATLSRVFFAAFGSIDDRKLDFVLSPPREISGRVTDREGRPIQGATIDAARWETLDNAGTSVGAATTGAEGEFDVTGLSPGAFTIDVKAPGFADQQLEGTRAGTSGVALVLDRCGSVAGSVRMPGGTPARRFTLVPVRLDSDFGRPLPPRERPRTFESTDGRFELVDLQPGVYVIQVGIEGFALTESEVFAVIAAKVTEDVDVVVDRGARLAGRVVDSHRLPVRGARVRIKPDFRIEPSFWPDPLPDETDDSHRISEARTDSEGRFELAALSPRSSLFVVDAPGCARFAVEGIALPDGETTRWESIVLADGGTIYVQCLDATGRRSGGAILSCSCDFMDIRRAADAEGRAVFEGLRPGIWSVGVAPQPGDSFVSILGKSKRQVAVREGSFTALELRLPPSPGD